MKTVAIVGERQAALVDRPQPRAAGPFAVVKIHTLPMCTEYKYFRMGDFHHPFGHEMAGEVVEIAAPGRLKIGDRVVGLPRPSCGKCALCRSGDYIHCPNKLNVARITGCETGTDAYAQYMYIQDWMAIPIPDDLSYEHASMACCGLGPAFGAMEAMQVGAFDTLLVTGLGPVGLGAVINAVYRGARVIGVEGNPYRANLAKALGAETVVDPGDPQALSQIRDLTGGLGVDKAVDCSGVAAAQRLMIDAARRKGQVSFVGEGGDLSVHASNDLLRKGLTLRGVWHFNLGAADRMMKLVRDTAASLDKAITHKFPMSRVQEAFELQLSGQCGKILVDPWA